MSGQKRWSKDAGGVEHPDSSILLAYVRQQSLDEDWSRVHQHINDCKQCSLHSSEYEQIGAGITQPLQHLQRTQFYPPLAANVLEFIHDPAAAQLARQQRQAKRRQSVGWMRLVPTGVAALLMLSMAVGIILHGMALQPNSNQQGGVNTVANHPLTSGGAGNGSVWTPAPGSTTTLPERATATPTANRDQPVLTLCEASQSHLVLCGSHLTAGDTLMVIVNVPDSRISIPSHMVKVDAKGTINVMWNINA